MTLREEHGDLLAEITALREHVASLNRRIADLQAALEQANDHEAATSEILRVISSSPTDVQPTFEAIAASATRLCAAGEGTLFRFDGTLIHLAAHCGLVQNDLVKHVFPRPAGPGSVTARAILTRSVVHIPDVTTDPDLEHSVLITAGFRTVLSVPMLRDGDPIGAITVSRQTVAPFSDAQIALLQTFADQAVIAIENVRLFTELQEKNRALTQAHAQVTETLERPHRRPTGLRHDRAERGTPLQRHQRRGVSSRRWDAAPSRELRRRLRGSGRHPRAVSPARCRPQQLEHLFGPNISSDDIESCGV